MAKAAAETPGGQKVRLALTVSLSRESAERLEALAIRQGKNLEALAAEILANHVSKA